MNRLWPRRVLFILGPTAAGKTALACALSERLPVRLISVDSAMVYRGMDIGTGKPDADEQLRHPHRLIDLCDPAESYSAARFREDALHEIELAIAEDRMPVLVGGTMLYFRALLQGLSELPEADQQLRALLELECAEKGLAAMHEQLAVLDPVAAARIHPNDPQRILRALEVFRLSGKSMTELMTAPTAKFPYPLFQLAVMPEVRQELHQRIESRFDQMLERGLVAEVAGLKTRSDLHEQLASLRCVGYRQVWDYLAGRSSYADMREQALIATRGLAKRQFTWLRSWAKDLVVPDSSAQSLDQLLKVMQRAPI